MSHRIASRCLLILLFSAGLPAQEPIRPRAVETPTPRVIVIETTPDIERSEVLRKVIEALEKDGTVKHATEEDRIGKPVGYMAQISARPDTPSESLQKLIKELQAVGIEKFSLRPTNEAESSVTITAPADVSLRQARRIGEVLAKHPQFEFEFLEAANNDPVTSTASQPSAVRPASRPPTPSPFGRAPSTLAGSPTLKQGGAAASAKPPVTKIFQLKKTRAAIVARIIEQLWGKEISVAVDEQANSLIMRGNEIRMQEIAALLTELDAPVQAPSGSAPQSEASDLGGRPKTQSPQTGPTPQANDLHDGGSPSKGVTFNNVIPLESAADLRKRSEEFEKLSQQTAEQLRRQFRDPSEETKRRESLRATVEKAFAARQDLLRAEHSELARRLHALQQSVEIRDRVSRQIIDRRIDELLNPDKQWNPNVPAANAASSEVTATEPSSPAEENKLLVRRSETSVKVEGRFDGNEEIVLVIGDPRFTAVANTAQELKDVKELKWTTPVNKAGEYVIEVRQDAVKLDGGATAPGLVFEVHNVPNTVQGTSYISFTDKDPLPNGKVVIASPKTKLLLKRKTDQVLVTVGHVELPGATAVVPINLVIRRRAGAGGEVKTSQNAFPVEARVPSQADKNSQPIRNLPGDTAAKLVARLQGHWTVKFADIGGLTMPDIKKQIVVRDRLLLLSLVAEGDVESISSWRLSWPDENRPDEVDVTFDPNSGVLPACLGRIECDGKSFRLCFNDGKSKTAKRPVELCPGESVCYLEGTKLPPKTDADQASNFDGKHIRSEAGVDAAFTRVKHFITGHGEKIACSTDGKLIAVVLGGLFAKGEVQKRTVEIWDAETGKSVASIALTTKDEEAILAATEGLFDFGDGPIAFSPDGTLLAVGTGLGQAKLFKPRTGELVLALDDESEKLAEQKTPEKLKSLKRAMGSVRSLAFSPDGTRLAMSGSSFDDAARNWGGVERLGELVTGPGRLKVWEVKSGTLTHDLVGHSHANALAFSPDGNVLASAGSWLGGGRGDHGSGVILWNPKTGAKLRTFPTNTNGSAWSVAFSPNSKLVAISARTFDKDNDTSTSSISLLRTATGILEWKQTVPSWGQPVAFSPDGKSVAVLCGGQSIRFFDAESGNVKHEIRAADSPQGGRWYDFALPPHGHSLAIGGVDNSKKRTVEIWAFLDPTLPRINTDINAGEKPTGKLPEGKANDSKSEAESANGQTKIAIGQISYSLPFNVPLVESILRLLPEGKARPKNERIVCELVKYQVSNARHYPLVGPAQLVRTRFKSTISSDAGRDVVYSDRSHLIRAQPE